MRRVAVGAAALFALSVAWIAYALNDRPSLAAYAGRTLDAPPSPGHVRVTFLGVSTLLVEDGETALLTDGFFTRPPLLRTLAGRIEPDRNRIGRALERAGIRKLAAVIVVHSHYDHAMDAPEVARRTGAPLIGSESTANVGRGWGLPEDALRLARSGEPLRFGGFRVTLVKSRHFPHGMAMGEILRPLTPPARAFDYREGGSYSVLFEHDDGSLLVQGSAGWVDGALKPYRADVVFLGIGALGNRDDEYKDQYWREVVRGVGARRVVPVHFDDFSRPLEEPLPLLPRLVDDVGASMRFLSKRAATDQVDLRLVPAWHPFDPFSGLRPGNPAN